MNSLRIAFSQIFCRGNWKFAGKTNKTISNWQRLCLALISVIGHIVTFLTLGNVTFWGDIVTAMKYAARK